MLKLYNNSAVVENRDSAIPPLHLSKFKRKVVCFCSLRLHTVLMSNSVSCRAYTAVSAIKYLAFSIDFANDQ